MTQDKFPGIPEKILDSAVRALVKWNGSSVTLDDCIETIRNEKAAVSILFLYFRHKSLIDNLIQNAASRGSVKSPLREIAACTLSQVLFQTGISRQSAVNIAVDYAKKKNPRLGGFMNALLRAALRNAGDGPFQPDFPELLSDRWVRSFGKEKAETAVSACGTNPPMNFRVRDESLPPDGSVPVETGFPFRFFSHETPSAVLNSELFRRGTCYIQDPATAWSISLCGELPENAEILDSCSAPGGKTVMLSDRYPNARITAADRSEKRLFRMRENFSRLGLSVNTVCADALHPPFKKESFDLVFIDAPCTNTGVIRRRPDAAWRFSLKRLAETAELQKRILSALAPLVRSGGVLLYSTCSVEDEEDSGQVEDFLREHPEFQLEESGVLLPDSAHDGAFAARLRKR